MANQKAGFVDEHIEKVAIGLCVLVLVGVVWYSFLGDRFSVNGVGPAELCQTVKDQSERTAQAIQNARPGSQANKPTGGQSEELERLPRWFTEGLIAVDGFTSPVGRTQRFPSLFVSAIELSEESRHALAKLVRPGIPLVTTGRTNFDLPEDKPKLTDYDPNQQGQGQATTRDWVSITSQVNLKEQEINFDSAKYPDGSFLSIVKVHLQRMDETQPGRGWQDVETFLPFRAFDRPRLDSTAVVDWGPLTEFRSMIASNQDYIARTKLPSRVSGDRLKYPVVPYFLDTPMTKDRDESDERRRAKSWLSAAKKAKSGKSGGSDLDTAFVLSHAVIQTSAARERDIKTAKSILKDVRDAYKRDSDRRQFVNASFPEPNRLMPIAAHDLGVIPGHTYRYRMRYEVYNTFVGLPNEMKNQQDAARLTVLSEWSPPSRSIEIESDFQLFLTKSTKKRREVVVSVRKKSRAGGYTVANFDIKVGDEIGGKKTTGRPTGDFTTGAVCVDIDFNRRIAGRRDVVLVYLDQHSGHLQELRLSVGKKAIEKFARR
ncbi:MAG: hypothetical protein MI923_18775 [Phycisphaerales bacterium]|nr:hypothetical protein [Phycisphaerales bacterium]